MKTKTAVRVTGVFSSNDHLSASRLSNGLNLHHEKDKEFRRDRKLPFEVYHPGRHEGGSAEFLAAFRTERQALAADNLLKASLQSQRAAIVHYLSERAKEWQGWKGKVMEDWTPTSVPGSLYFNHPKGPLLWAQMVLGESGLLSYDPANPVMPTAGSL